MMLSQHQSQCRCHRQRWRVMLPTFITEDSSPANVTFTRPIPGDPFITAAIFASTIWGRKEGTGRFGLWWIHCHVIRPLCLWVIFTLVTVDSIFPAVAGLTACPVEASVTLTDPGPVRPVWTGSITEAGSTLWTGTGFTVLPEKPSTASLHLRAEQTFKSPLHCKGTVGSHPSRFTSISNSRVDVRCSSWGRWLCSRWSAVAPPQTSDWTYISSSSPFSAENSRLSKVSLFLLRFTLRVDCLCCKMFVSCMVTWSLNNTKKTNKQKNHQNSQNENWVWEILI